MAAEYIADNAVTGGVLDTPQDAGKGGEGVVRRWKLEIELADKRESGWLKNAQEAIKIYRSEDKKQNSFNILWSNIEVLRPNLYNSTPRPDVRRRYRDADPVGKQVAEVMERCLSYEIDLCDFDRVMEGVVLDAVRQGRGVARICFEPSYEKDTEGNDVLGSSRTYARLVQWDKFKRGSGATWEEVQWICYEHELTKEEAREKFTKYGSRLDYDAVMLGTEEGAANREPSIFKRIKVWEIWDKETRRILWIAPGFQEAPLLVEKDKYGLSGFFDIPRPVYSIDDTTTLDPVVEYDLYKAQAKELNRISARINHLTDCLKIRGIYDATITEIGRLTKASEGDLIPAESATMAMQAGGIDKAIWLMPIQEIAVVLRELYMQRDQAKMAIYEITGLSDIMRGQSNPSETLGAQQLKANNASVRIQRRQRDVQRFARDLLRIMAEIIAEHYTPEMMTMISGINVTPEMIDVLRRDLPRGIRIDVETDSTIAADQAQDRQQVSEMLQGVGSFVTAFSPAVQSGAVSMEAAKKIMLSVMRKAKLGREVEDAIEQDAAQPPQNKPDPEAMKFQAEQQQKQAEMQMKQQEMAASMQMEQARAQATLQLEQAKMQAEQQKAQAEMQMKQQELQVNLQLDTAKKQHEAVIQEQKIEFEKEKAVAELALKREEMLLRIKLQREEMELKSRLEEKRAIIDAELAKKEKDDEEKSQNTENDKEEGRQDFDLSPIASALERLGSSNTKISITSDEKGNISGEMVKG